MENGVTGSSPAYLDDGLGHQWLLGAVPKKLERLTLEPESQKLFFLVEKFGFAEISQWTEAQRHWFFLAHQQREELRETLSGG